MIVVTGAAGFIGANLVKALNETGQENILAVDDLTQADKIFNLADCVVADYMDKDEFIAKINNGTLDNQLQAIFHEGANSDTMASDGREVMNNNYRFTRDCYEFCRRNKTAFIYASSASVYGGGQTFIESAQYEQPLNAYAYSKYAFDHYVRQRPPTDFQAVGLRYFNVYGPREQHKGRMASVAYHFFHQYVKHEQLKLFQGSGGYAHGAQQRDFVSVDDVVKVNLFLLNNPKVSGCFLNVGTGKSRSFNDVAVAVINALHLLQNKPEMDLELAVKSNKISYIPMPDALQGKYQSFTEADISALRQTGYSENFDDVDVGVERYVCQLWEARNK